MSFFKPRCLVCGALLREHANQDSCITRLWHDAKKLDASETTLLIVLLVATIVGQIATISTCIYYGSQSVVVEADE